MYHYVALDFAYTIVRVVLFLIAATFWILYIHETLFRSGRIRTQWLKKGLADLALILFIGLVSSLIFMLVSGFHSGRHH